VARLAVEIPGMIDHIIGGAARRSARVLNDEYAIQAAELVLKESGAASKAALRSFQYGSVGRTCRTISDWPGAAPLLGSKAGERRKTLAETKSFPLEP
jgi:hypothetical protein